ncbi:MAG: hypothetical protein KDD42_07180 [Bdellovibrionales bacterium]|nr:hypothetical protein [Bdellovibrionales bacterium]
MKIPGSSDEAKKGQAVSSVEETRKRETEKLKREQPAASDSAMARTIGRYAQDTVDLSLSKYIQSEFDPNKVERERQARFEELKKLVQSGNYEVPSDTVAEALERSLDEHVSILKILESNEEK